MQVWLQAICVPKESSRENTQAQLEVSAVFFRVQFHLASRYMFKFLGGYNGLYTSQVVGCVFTKFREASICFTPTVCTPWSISHEITTAAKWLSPQLHFQPNLKFTIHPSQPNLYPWYHQLQLQNCIYIFCSWLSPFKVMKVSCNSSNQYHHPMRE